MKRYESAFSSAATKVAGASKKTAQEYAEKQIPDEPSFTAALATRVRDGLNGYAKGGITWHAKILSSHGPNTEESKFGADLLGALALDLPGYSVKKGFLAQAKRQEPESFVFVYGLNGVFAVPAIGVAACIQPEDLHTLHPKTLSGFYKEHFMCFVGDRRIDGATPAVLDRLLTRVSLSISGSVTDKGDLFSSDNNA